MDYLKSITNNSLSDSNKNDLQSIFNHYDCNFDIKKE
jgi:hypothetical protein